MKIGIFSVGSSEKPIIFSIKKNKIDFAIFLCSKWTYSKIEIIKKELENENIELKKIKDFVVENFQDINSCYKKSKEIVSYLSDFDNNEIIIDITGGTKVMSSALLSATAGKGYKYFYVGSIGERTGNVNDKEMCLYPFEDPYLIFHENEKKLFEIFFNNYAFENASKIFENLKLIKKYEEDLYSGLRIISESYSKWDRFEITNNEKIKIILKDLNEGKRKIETYYRYNEKEKPIIDIFQIEENIKFLEKLFSIESSKFLIIDLFFNSQRRAEQKRYDDATARLYATIEQLAHFELNKKYNINSSNLEVKKLPEYLREKYFKEDVLALCKKYDILHDLNNELGKKFKEKEEELKKILDARNNSILAHGLNSITKEQYEKFANIVKEFINPEFEIKFPKIRFD
ncbi:MAG: TIGR02710 family CRISPR-associated CARF protein [Candidatus Woesearchaeota archaeon]